MQRRLQEENEMDNRPQNAIEDELERIKSLKRKAARMIEAEQRRLMAMEQKRQEIKRRLASMGICPAGFVAPRRIWIQMRRRIVFGFVWTTWSDI